MTTPSEASIRTERAAATQRLAAAVARTDSQQTRSEAAALRAESRQARRQAQAVIEERNAILDAAVEITSEVLARGRYALARPVSARFMTSEYGSSGVEITVRLRDTTRAAAAEVAIAERFGGAGISDSFNVS